MLNELIKPEYLAIAVIAVLILVTIFISIIANKISNVDGKINELTENVHRRVEKNVGTLADSMHQDFIARSREQEETMNKMGDSWRSSLDKTVTDVKSEVGKLKGEVEQNSKALRGSLLEIIQENSVNFNEQFAFVRDTHGQTMQDYHQQLATSIREHAISERDVFHKALNEMSTSVEDNLSTLAQNQQESINKVSQSVGSGYSNLAQKIEEDLTRSTSSVEKSLNNITSTIYQTVEKSALKLNTDLDEITVNIDEDLNSVKSKFDTNLSQLSSNLTSNLSSLSERLDTDIDKISSKLDTSITTVSDKLGDGINQVTNKVSSDMSGISSDLTSALDQLTKNVDTNFDKVGSQIDNRIHDDMNSLIDVFKGFAAKVDAIENTRTQILGLAENVNILSQVLDDRRSRGNMGKVLIESVVADNLSPADYELNATLSNGEKVNCLLKLPKPSGNVAISTQFDISDLEVIQSASSSENEITKARDSFADKLDSAIQEISSNFIIKGETAEGAILMLPSESAFSEAHVKHRQLVDKAYKNQVWLASPSTLIAMVTVARTVIKDATARNDMEKIRIELSSIEQEYKKLENNFSNISHTVDDLLTHAMDTRKSARKIGDRFNQLNSIFSASPNPLIEEKDEA